MGTSLTDAVTCWECSCPLAVIVAILEVMAAPAEIMLVIYTKVLGSTVLATCNCCHVKVLSLEIPPVFSLQVDFPASSRKTLQTFVSLMRRNVFNVSYLFSSDEALVKQYGPTPYIDKLQLQYKHHVAPLGSPGSLCPARPPTAVYAPARARLRSGVPVQYQGFHLVLSFDAPFDLVSNCSDSSYSCLLGVGKGAVVPGSALQLDNAGTLYKVQCMGVLLSCMVRSLQ